jgi:cyclopropane fatty-acyl-phospholipid synthase-like methyltransferase
MDYRSENNEFYSRMITQNPLYATPYPNAEEAARAAVILEYLGRIAQSYFRTGITPHILDLGCGRGWLTALVSTFGLCEGIDPSSAIIEVAKAYFPNLTFHCATLSDFTDSPSLGPYDIIVSSEVIEHVPYTQKKHFVEQIRENLKPRAQCIVTTPRRELLWVFSRRHTASQLIEDWLTEKELRSLFISCGFSIVKHTRAFPMRPRRFEQSVYGQKIDRFLTQGKLGFLIHGLEYILSIYQIWWFRKL